jgi:hypothetical protein
MSDYKFISRIMAVVCIASCQTGDLRFCSNILQRTAIGPSLWDMQTTNDDEDDVPEDTSTTIDEAAQYA